MDNKLLLIDLIEKYREVLYSNYDYVLCNQLLTKIGSSILTYNSDDVKLNLSEVFNITEEEMKLFTSPECVRIISALKELHNNPNLRGWSVNGAYNLIKRLQDDVLNNKMVEFKKQEESLDELFKIVEEGLWIDNYQLILDFIKMSVDNEMLSLHDAINLNFYVLREFNNLNATNINEVDSEVVELTENMADPDDVRRRLEEIFTKYGYAYNQSLLGELDSKLVKYADVDYVDYVLSKFNEYGVSANDVSIRMRTLCNIIVDNDRDAFDSILEFIAQNECTLSFLLTIPAIFSKRKKSYIEKGSITPDFGNSVLEIVGANNDFFENIELYKNLSVISVVTDADLDKLGKFLCTPSSIVKKNLKLLQKYCIVGKKELPKSIGALCGKDTEYIIDRLIELDLYESYLSPRITKSGEVKQPRGTYFLDLDANLFRFYKMKRAKDLGQAILASNGGIKKVFTYNSQSFAGISYDEENGVIQEPLSLDMMLNIDPSKRKELPYILKAQIADGTIPKEMIKVIYFNNLYKYTTFGPIDIFDASDKIAIAGLKGDRIATVFEKDYKTVVTEEETRVALFDGFIKMLDNAVHCDSDGNSRPLKTSDMKYEFSHPSLPNINLIISRKKVLRLCKLLKEDGCWINQDSSNIDKENTLLSVIMKDTIVCDTEMIMLRLAIREILTNGFIKVPKIKDNNVNKRSAR